MARVPNLQRYCDLVARAQTELSTTPAHAKQAAEEAERALPGHAAPLVILARAELALGAVDDAARAFVHARSIDPRSVDSPATMHDLARVLFKTGKRDEAIEVYRALIPRIDLLATADRRVLVLLEAAHAFMTVAGTRSTGDSTGPGATARAKPAEPALDEAVAYLREARGRPPTQLAGDVLLSLALVLDRTGNRDEANATLAAADRMSTQVRGNALGYVAAPEDGVALEALALEASDPAAAQRGWEAYLAGPGGKGPWRTAARRRVDLLKRKPSGRPAKQAQGEASARRPR